MTLYENIRKSTRAVFYSLTCEMAAPPLKGTRKTYSFEEREILITLINKYGEIEDKRSDPVTMCKRKSAWSQLAEEYNSMVGPQSMRSAIQLRRCWENMKACKRNREQKKLRNRGHNICHEPPVSTGLPPNVVFEPKESEPFTLQSVCTLKPLKLNLKQDSCNADPDSSESKIESNAEKREESVDKFADDLDSTSLMERSDEECSDTDRLIYRSNTTQTSISPLAVRETSGRSRRLINRGEELHVLALSEAQIKVDLAAMLKEEARIKLEEAHYRKEEARLRMLFFTHKLDRIKEHDSRM